MQPSASQEERAYKNLTRLHPDLRIPASRTVRNMLPFLKAPHLWYFVMVALRASLVAHMVKHLPTRWETRVRSLGREDPLEKEMATCSSTLAWKIPWTEKPGRLQSMGLQRVRHD